MTIETEGLIQFGVLWAAQGTDEFSVPRIIAPVQFRCRWELGVVLTNSPLNNNYRITGQAFVDRPIPLESIVWQGKLSERPPIPVPLMQVIDYREVPDDKCRNFRRTIILTAWSDKLPPAIT